MDEQVGGIISRGSNPVARRRFADKSVAPIVVSGPSWDGERTARQKTVGELLLPGDGTLPKALRVRRGIYRKTTRLDLADQSLRGSISDRCQIPDDTFGRRCSGSLSSLFSPEQKLSPPRPRAADAAAPPTTSVTAAPKAQEPKCRRWPACWPSSIRLSGSGA